MAQAGKPLQKPAGSSSDDEDEETPVTPKQQDNKPPPPDNKTLVGAGDPALFNVLDTAVMADKELFPSQSPLLATPQHA